MTGTAGETGARSRRARELYLNNLKYELMVLNQDLSRIVPSSKLSEELLVKRSGLQQEISKIEDELSVKPVTKTEGIPIGVKKLRDEDGQVRIWSSSSDE